MKNLEEYLRAKREQLDLHEPPSDSWEEVRKSLPRIAKKRNMGWKYMSLAASVLILIMALFYFQKQSENPGSSPLALDQELVQVDRHYAQQIALAQTSIDQRQEEIQKMIAAYPELESKFRDDLQNLNKTYLKLKGDLPNNANQEVLLKAMISNLQLQIDVLENQLTIIERINNTIDDESSTPI